ncbi:unnamed protein product [Didymodactylos carnosus]|uniref:Macro domain-containing protein n=1 Tax=Didymodactylos carnosus TaxID=1234261 RepID=A0A815TPZ4_9BILA|nr:unnamed protein product [Didymodactylos carnosus]CAF4367275.1 unnamed protein product [Didymodactylos carnosus]
MRGGGGLDGAIHAKAGKNLLLELEEKVPHRAQTGEVIVTKGYKTDFDYILHVAGPLWGGGYHDEESKLRASYVNAIKEADKLNIETLAFASISTGIYGYPLDQATPVALETCAYELKTTTTLKNIVFAMFQENEFKTFTKAYETIFVQKSEL